MKKYIVIDGNNLLHKISELRNLFYKNPESAQLSLLEKIKMKTGRDGKIVLVFDGYGKENNIITYSGKLTADEIIRRFIEDNHEKSSLTVVSSDAYITSLARACGCEVIKSENYLSAGKGDKPGAGKKEPGINNSEKPEYTSKKYFEEFKKFFSD